MPSLSHLTSCKPTKYKSYLANSLAAAVSEPALYRLFTLQVPNLISLFYCVCCTKRSVKVRGSCIRFVTGHLLGEALLTHQPSPEFKGQTLSTVCDCLFNIFITTLRIVDRSSIHNPRTCHVVVTGTYLTRYNSSYSSKCNPAL